MLKQCKCGSVNLILQKLSRMHQVKNNASYMYVLLARFFSSCTCSIAVAFRRGADHRDCWLANSGVQIATLMCITFLRSTNVANWHGTSCLCLALDLAAGGP